MKMSASQIPSTKRRRAAAAPAVGAKEATAGRRRGLATLPTNTQPGEDKENALGGNKGKKGGKAAGGGFGFGSRPVTKARKRPDKAASATRSRSTMEQARLDKELAAAKEQIADFDAREAAADAELGAAKAELQVARDAIAAMKGAAWVEWVCAMCGPGVGGVVTGRQGRRWVWTCSCLCLEVTARLQREHPHDCASHPCIHPCFPPLRLSLPCVVVCPRIFVRTSTSTVYSLHSSSPSMSRSVSYPRKCNASLISLCSYP